MYVYIQNNIECKVLDDVRKNKWFELHFRYGVQIWIIFFASQLSPIHETQWIYIFLVMMGFFGCDVQYLWGEVGKGGCYGVATSLEVIKKLLFWFRIQIEVQKSFKFLFEAQTLLVSPLTVIHEYPNSFSNDKTLRPNYLKFIQNLSPQKTHHLRTQLIHLILIN
jgi:hypothetical protein